jgi:peroxiredoxin
MNSPLRFTAIRSILALGALLIAIQARAQSDPKHPHVETAPSPTSTQDLTPHAGLLIAGQVVIGQPAPAFELDGSLGRPIQLSTLRGDWTVLLFMPRMESALDLVQTQRSLHAVNIQVVGICHEKARTVEAFAQRNRLAWLLLADVTGEVGAMYGVWNAAQRDFDPGLVLLDARGIVRYASIGHALSPDQIRDIVLDAREKI